MAWEFESTENKLKQGRLIVPSGERWNDFLEVVTAEKVLETKVAKRCLLAQFETMFWKLALLRKYWNQWD